MSQALPPGLNRTILVVDDAETCAATLELALVGLGGAGVAVARTGVEALEVLGDAGREVCAVITDLNMPRMDGFELIRRIRADCRHASIPILVTSAETDPRAHERATQAGANAYFPKPYSPGRVRQKLEQLLDENPSARN